MQASIAPVSWFHPCRVGKAVFVRAWFPTEHHPELWRFVPARFHPALLSTEWCPQRDVPNLVSLLFRGPSADGLQSCWWPPLRGWSTAVNFYMLTSESGWPELALSAKEKKIHKLFSLLKCLPGRFWAVLVWLIPMDLFRDNYSQNPSCVGHFMLLRHKYRKRTAYTVFKFFAMLFLNATSSCPAPYPSLLFC